MKNQKIVMIPGPTPGVHSIEAQMGRKICSFKDPDFVKDYKELIVDMKDMLETAGECFIVAGTGTLAMEMAVANVTKRDDNVLIISHGYFGDRFINLCERKGLNVDVISCDWGDTVPLEKIESKLNEKNYSVITVTQVDTSTGVVADVAGIGEIVSKFKDTLLIVDGVCATGAERTYVNQMNIDVLLTGSQKAFGVSPGLALVWASKSAMARRAMLGVIPEFYADFDMWLPIMKDPSKYFGTPPIHLIWALKESVRLIKEEGLEARYDRHISDARAIEAAILALGFKILAKDGCRATTLTNCIYPEGIDDAEFRRTLAEEGVVVAGGLGDYAGKLFRLGHMGNIDKHIVVSALSGIERTLIRLGHKFEEGIGVKTYIQLSEEIA